jgi:2-phosphosulfolactate phosphatase
VTDRRPPRPLPTRIHRGLDELEELTGAVVVIDVFRASNTVIALLEAGAAEVVLVADVDRARELRRDQPDRLLLGERGGVAPSDFDGGNSPAAAHRLVRPGDQPILTTSAGTQALHRLGGADLVLVASFANAAAVVSALCHRRPRTVTLLPMGLEARTPALEDDEAARWIAAGIDGRPRDFDRVRRRLLACDGADRLRRLGQHDDLAWCTRLDSHDLVPVVLAGDPPRAVRGVLPQAGDQVHSLPFRRVGERDDGEA